MTSIIIPPSPNWFVSNALDVRIEDRLLAAACFKLITIHQLADGSDHLFVKKVIPFIDGKVLAVSLPPISWSEEYRNSVIGVGDFNSVSIFNWENGSRTGSHKAHGNLNVNCVTCAEIDSENYVVSAGDGGIVVVWNLRQGLTKNYVLFNQQRISLVKTDPADKSRVLFASSQTISLVTVKNCSTIMQFRGHDHEVYAISWFCGDHLLDGQNLRQALVKSKEEVENFPLFVSSDFQKNIFVWNVDAKHYIMKIVAPGGQAAARKTKEKTQKVYVPLAWHGSNLLSCSANGELLRWTFTNGKATSKVITQNHNRFVYNLEVINNIAITCGHDRYMTGFDLVKSANVFKIPTLGCTANDMSFSPHDFNWLAIGMQENTVRIFDLSNLPMLSSTSFYHNIKGKIFSIDWHPAEEGVLLFGTSDGQVGVIDTVSSQVNVFAYYHQKTVYKVQWAPPLCSSQSGLHDSWYAYSYGDRDIVIRDRKNEIGDPVFIKNLLSYNEGTHSFCSKVTEFSFSPDYEFLAYGCQDGQIYVFHRTTLELRASILAVHKAVQHLLWKPFTASFQGYTLAVGSNENSIPIFNLCSTLDAQVPCSERTITMPNLRLSGHEARVVWLSWSPHKEYLLASASYDHTIQLWDTQTGVPVGNYGGHSSRLFRVEFSPIDSDLMFSFAEENCVHSWRPSGLTCQTVKETLALSKGQKKKQKSVDAAEETKSKAQAAGKSAVQEAIFPSMRKTFKSFFPNLHSVSAKKKGFFHLAALTLLSSDTRDQDKICDKLGQLSDQFPSLLNIQNGMPEEVGTLQVYRNIVEVEDTDNETEDMKQFLKFFSDAADMDDIVEREVSTHQKQENFLQAGVMHLWRGSFDSFIREAAHCKRLNSFLVSLTPQVSMSLWEYACEMYAEQLVEEGDIISASSYLLGINQVEECVNLLTEHRYFREALALVQLRLSYDTEILNKVLSAWSDSSIYDGNFCMGAIIKIKQKQYLEAARIISRRLDPGALFVAAKSFQAASEEPLATATALLSLKEASVQQEHAKIPAILHCFPDLKWYNYLHLCHLTILKHLKAYEQSIDGGSQTCDQGEVQSLGGLERSPCILNLIQEDWKTLRSEDTYEYSCLEFFFNLNFVTLSVPASVKQLWYFVSVSLCRMLLSSDEVTKKKYLEEAIMHALSWGRADQIYILAHLLLPHGNTTSDSGRDCLPSEIELLDLIYSGSEVEILSSIVTGNPFWLPWSLSCRKDAPGMSPEYCNEATKPSKLNAFMRFFKQGMSEAEVATKMENYAKNLNVDHDDSRVRSYISLCISMFRQFVELLQGHKVFSDSQIENWLDLFSEKGKL